MTLAAAQTLFIDVRHIDLHPDRPRRRIDREGLDALALSIEQHGLLQPILVRQTGHNRYELLAGERRLLAHKDLGCPGIAAVLATGSPPELSLVENLHRESLDALELAASFAGLTAKGWSREALAQLVGKSRTWVGDVLSLTALPDSIKAEYPEVRRVVSRSLLVEIARVRDPEAQAALWEEAKAGALTVRAARQKRRETAPALPRALTSVRRCTAQLGKLEAVELEDADREALVALRARIDALLIPSPPWGEG